jgi:aldehyde dehydrogenase (NAD+)
MRAAGLEIVEETWPNHSKYATAVSCSLRIVIARKPTDKLTYASWNGKWEVSKRAENWHEYLSFLGVPQAAHEIATKAPDFHEYRMSPSSFFLDHRIPAQGMHLKFTAFFEDSFNTCPYPRPTAKGFTEGEEANPKSGLWRNTWISEPTSFKTEIPDFAGTGKTVVLTRTLTSTADIEMSVTVYDGDKVVVGPCKTWMAKLSDEPPLNAVAELRTRAMEPRDVAWRREKIAQVGKLIEENVAAFSQAQEEDGVTPSNFFGASKMVFGAVQYYQALVGKWAAPTPVEETLPPPMRVPEGEWLVVPEPKGVGLVIAPWNAPVLLCVLPLMGMLSAGNLCVLKPSETTPACSRLLAKLIPQYFPCRSVLVAEGGPDVVRELIDTRVDHIVFTGGGEVAKKVLALASKHLTPVSLELGGKNPCFVDKCSAEEMQVYIKEIIGTKAYFGGMFCQAHDFCLVHEDVFDEFVRCVTEAIAALGDRRSLKMITVQHAKRVAALMAGQEARAVPALPAADCFAPDKDTAHLPLTAVVSPDPDSPLMQSEIFGPLLPILKVKDVNEAADFVRARPKPLVTYCYSPDENSWKVWEQSTSSGNCAINCGPQRMQSNFNVGFGGVGDSGFGYSIWGKAAFDDYSHAKPVFKCASFAGSLWGAAAPTGPPATGGGYPKP